MKSRRVPIRVLVVVVGVLAAGAVAFWRLNRPSPERDPVGYWIDRARSEFARFEFVPASETPRIGELVGRAPINDPEGRLLEGDADRLRESLRAVLVERLGATDAVGYIEAMESLGYRLVDETTAAHQGIHLDLLARLIAVPRGTPREMFEALWQHQDAPQVRGARIAAIASDPRALLITVGHGDLDGFMSQAIEGQLGAGLWRGGTASSCRRWFVPPQSRESLIERFGEIPSATLSIVVEGTDGTRHPLMLHAFRDPSTGRWWIDAANTTNVQPTAARWNCQEF